MVVVRWNFPDGADDDTLTAELAGASAIDSTGGTSVIDTAYSLGDGITKSALMTKTTTGHHWFAVEGLSSETLGVDAYFYFHSLPDADIYLLWVGSSSSVRNLAFQYRQTAGTIRVMDSAANVAWAGTTPVTGQWYRLSLWLDRANGEARAAIYDKHSTTPIGSSGLVTGLDLGTTAPDRVRIGPGAASAAAVSTVSIGSWAYDTATSDLLAPIGVGDGGSIADKVRYGSTEPGAVYYNEQPINRVYYGSAIVRGEEPD